MRVAARIFSTALMIGSLFTAAPASAAAPSNDTPVGARVISTLPTTIVQNIRGAKAEPLDRQLIATGCGYENPNPVAASVWFKYTDVSGQGIGYIPTGDFPYDMVVTKGDPAQGNIVSCGIQDIRGEPGATYYFGIFANYLPAGTGNLRYEFFGLPQAEIVVDKAVLMDGLVRVYGRYRCTPGAEVYAIDVQVIQRRTRGSVFSDFPPEPCTGRLQKWTELASPFAFPEVVLKPGKARVIATVFAADNSREDFPHGVEASTERTVHVRRAHKAASSR